MVDIKFTIPGCTQQGTGATAVLPNKLWYFFRAPRSGSDNTPVLMRTTYDTAFADSSTFGNTDAWAPPIEVKVPPLAGYADAVASGQPPEGSPIIGAQAVFALTSGDALYLFWSDATGNVYGTKSAGDDLWTPSFRLEGLQSVPGPAYGLSGYFFENKLVMACFSTLDEENFEVHVSAFAEGAIGPSPMGTGQIWVPLVESGHTFSSFTGAPTGQCSLSVSWAILPCALDSQGVPLGRTGSQQLGSAPVAFFNIMVPTTAHVQAVFTYVMDPATGLPTNTRYDAPLTFDNQRRFGSLDLDASNTMYCYTLTGDNQLLRQPLMDAAGALTLGTTSPILSHNEPLFSMGPARLGYVASSPQPGQLKTSGAPDATVLTTAASSLYRFIFLAPSAGNSPVWVYIQYYGKRHLVATVNDLYLQDEANPDARQQALVAKGIIDGPLPVPGQNLRMLDQGGTLTDGDLYKPLGRVTFGTNRSDDTTHQLELTGAVGTKTSFEMSAGVDSEATISAGFDALVFSSDVSTTLGAIKEMIGVKFDVTHTTTVADVLREGRATVHESNVVGLTRVVPDASSPQAPPRLSTQGFISGSSLSVHCLAVAFEDPHANPGVLPSRPSVISFMPSSKLQLGANYTADYAFTPGQLASYSTSAINAKMAAAYTTWRTNHPDQDDPFGEDYTQYFEKVINPLALRIGPGGRNYLEFIITNNGFTEAHFDLSKHTFQEWGVRVDSSRYKATTWDNLVNTGGFELQSYLENGVSFEFGAGYTEETERSMKWGISASLENFPEATRPGDVCAYSFRLYLLPSDNRWAQEVLCFSDYSSQPANGLLPLDPGSRPWKLMFFVEPTSILTLKQPS